MLVKKLTLSSVINYIHINTETQMLEKGANEGEMVN